MEDINLTYGDTAHSSNRQLAVGITNAYKAYSSTIIVLNGFNMNVEKGTMYVLHIFCYYFT